MTPSLVCITDVSQDKSKVALDGGAAVVSCFHPVKPKRLGKLLIIQGLSKPMLLVSLSSPRRQLSSSTTVLIVAHETSHYWLPSSVNRFACTECREHSSPKLCHQAQQLPSPRWEYHMRFTTKESYYWSIFDPKGFSIIYDIMIFVIGNGKLNVIKVYSAAGIQRSHAFIICSHFVPCHTKSL